MKTHVIVDGVVINTIVSTVEEAQVINPDALCLEATAGGIGWTWDGTELSSPISTQTVPESVTPRQGRIVLARYGLLSAVDSYFSTLTGDGADEAKIEWEYAQEWRRDWQMLVDAAHYFELTDTQIDQMFIEAAQL